MRTKFICLPLQSLHLRLIDRGNDFDWPALEIGCHIRNRRRGIKINSPRAQFSVGKQTNQIRITPMQFPLTDGKFHVAPHWRKVGIFTEMHYPRKTSVGEFPGNVLKVNWEPAIHFAYRGPYFSGDGDKNESSQRKEEFLTRAFFCSITISLLKVNYHRPPGTSYWASSPPLGQNRNKYQTDAQLKLQILPYQRCS